MVVLESTVGLELPLADTLPAESLPVAVNLGRVRDFTKAAGKLPNTNVLDA